MEATVRGELTSRSEGVVEEPVHVEARRLSRRGLLGHSALAVAGLAALSGMELVRPTAVRADEGGDSPISNLEFMIPPVAVPPPIVPLPRWRICRHVYCYLYRLPGGEGGVSVPTLQALEATYRLNIGPDVASGGSLAEMLAATESAAPFSDPARGSFPGVPGELPGGRFLPTRCGCYRLVTRYPSDPRYVQVCVWCSCYCYPGNCIVIEVGGHCVCYCVPHETVPTGSRIVLDDAPRLTAYWEQRALSTGIGGLYYLTYSSPFGASSTATWSGTLDVPSGTVCRVEAHIPGSTTPDQRTSRATYEIAGLRGPAQATRVTISQQTATSQWVSLGDLPFAGGLATVRLTDETGESNRVVVADAVRWTLP